MPYKRQLNTIGRYAVVRGSMISRIAALVTTLALTLTLALTPAYAQTSERDLIVDYITRALCYDEASDSWRCAMRFSGPVGVYCTPGVPQAIRDHIALLLPRINDITAPMAVLVPVPEPTTLPLAITVYYGPDGKRAFEAASHCRITAQANGYFAMTGPGGHTQRGYVWIASGLDAHYALAITSQELTQVLGPGADAHPGAEWTDPGDLWRDAYDLPLWLSPREHAALRVLYRDLQGGETDVTTRRIVGESYDRLVVASLD